MPFINIDLFEGRSDEVKEELALKVAELVAEVTGADVSKTFVFIRDLKEGEFYPQGKLRKKD